MVGNVEDATVDTIEDKMCGLDIEEYNVLLRASIIQDDVDVDYVRDTRTLQDTERSKGYFLRRYLRKGVTAETYVYLYNHPQVANELIESEAKEVEADMKRMDLNHADTKHTIGNGTTTRKSGAGEMAKIIDSFRKTIKVPKLLDPAVVSERKFRRSIRILQGNIKAQSQIVGADGRFGYQFFRSCLSINARNRFDFFVADVDEDAFEERIELGIRHLCDEESDIMLRKNFQDELDSLLSRKNFRFVDDIFTALMDLIKLFPSVEYLYSEVQIHVEKMLAKHKYGADLLLSIADVDFSSLEQLMYHCRKREKILMKAERSMSTNLNTNLKGDRIKKADGDNWRKKHCRFWITRGKCTKGKNCKFLHDDSKRATKKRFCNQWAQKGSCTFGERCKFVHESKPNANANANDAAEAAAGGNRTTKADQDDERSNDSNVIEEPTYHGMVDVAANMNDDPEIILVSKPYELNPTLRDRRMLRSYFSGKDGPCDTMTLLDDGSQPSTISKRLLDDLKKKGVKFLFRKTKGYVQGLNTGRTEVIGEVEYEVKIKKARTSGYVALKTHSIVLEGRQNHECIVGVDVRNLHRIQSILDPNPHKRKVFIDGIEVLSYPCSELAETKNKRTLSVKFKLGKSNSQKKKYGSNAITLECGMIDHPEQLLEGHEKAERDPEAIEKLKQQRELMARDNLKVSQGIERESSLLNAEMTSSETVLKLLDRIQDEVNSNKSMMTSNEQFYYFRRIVCRYARMFVDYMPECGKLKMKPHDLKDWLKSDAKLVKQKPYRLPPDRLMAMEQKLEEMESQGLCYKIRDESEIIASSPAFPVWDKTKKTPRVVISCKKVNDAMKLMFSIMPVCERTMVQVVQAQWIIASDAKSGWPQLGCTKWSQRVLVFVTQQCARSSEGLPFGYKNAPQVFAQEMATLFADLLSSLAHVDDFYNYGDTFFQALEEFCKFLQKCEAKNLYLSAKKVHAFPRKLEIVGIEKDGQKYYPAPRRLYVIDEIQEPKKGKRFVRSVQRIVGLFIYYLKFLPNFWNVIAPIKDSIKPDAPQVWELPQQEALAKAKQMLKDAMLFVPDFDQTSEDNPFLVDSDASKCAGGGTLSQTIDGVERLIYATSFVFSRPQRNWHIIRKENFAGLKCLVAFDPIIKGCPVLLRQDARCAIYMINHAQDRMREHYTRMSAGYSSYMLVGVQYREGSRHKNADPFTRDTKAAREATKSSDDKEHHGVHSELFPKHYEAAMEWVEGQSPGSSGWNLEVNCAHPAEACSHEVYDNLEASPIQYQVMPTILQSNEVELHGELLDELSQRQQKVHQKLFDAIDDEKNPNHHLVSSQYKVIDGILHKMADFELGQTIPMLIVVPDDKGKQKVMQAYHIDRLMAHRNANDLAAKILRTYYWRGVHKDCRQFVADCQACIRSKTRMKRLPYAQSVVRGPVECVSLDAIGKIAGKKHHLLLLCLLSIGCAWGKAIKKLNAKVYAEFLMDFIVTFGLPKRILTDQGGEFMNDVAVHLKNRFKFKTLYASSKNSQGNSKIERLNRAFNEGIIAQLIQACDKKENWSNYVEGVIFSMNTLKKNSRGYSPAELLFGFQPRFAADMEMKRMRYKDPKVIPAIDERIERINQMRMLFQTLQSDNRFAQNYKHNAKCGQLQQYEVGDRVWLYRKEDRKDCPVRNKYNIKKTGPCTVTAKSERSNTYTVVDEATGYRNQVHAKWLSPEGTYHKDADDAPYEDSSDDSEMDDDASSSSEDDNDEAQIDVHKEHCAYETITKKS